MRASRATMDLQSPPDVMRVSQATMDLQSPPDMARASLAPVVLQCPLYVVRNSLALADLRDPPDPLLHPHLISRPLWFLLGILPWRLFWDCLSCLDPPAPQVLHLLGEWDQSLTLLPRPRWCQM
ncbi:uncharacterized protein ACWYII_024248 isoform 6-T8 [Salvelinus alpinus]